MRTDSNYSEKTLTITQVRSAIGNKPKNRGTLRALGLRKIGDTNVLPDRPEIRGMIARIPHLIEVTEGTPEKGNG
jgi:large subunit ribosomal protein L30